MVIMDTGVISAAPVRLLVPVWEMHCQPGLRREPIRRQESHNGRWGVDTGGTGYCPTLYTTLLEDGYKAKVAVEQGVRPKR